MVKITQDEQAQVPKVYAAIAAVAADMSAQGISKTRQNVQQGYKFRGIDEVMNALSPSLVKHGLMILPRVMGRTVTERVTAKGGTLFYVIVESEFDFVAAVDGSKHTVKTFGEAMDSGDKATNKAMSAAYKYAAFQAFCIPLEGDGDHDADTTTPPEVRRPAPPAKHTEAQKVADHFNGTFEEPAAGEPASSDSKPTAPPTSAGSPVCPTCHGPMWDNRDKRREAEAEIKAGTRELNAKGKPKAAPPAWKCKDKGCKGTIWECGGPKPEEHPTGPDLPEGATLMVSTNQVDEIRGVKDMLGWTNQQLENHCLKITGLHSATIKDGTMSAEWAGRLIGSMRTFLPPEDEQNTVDELPF